MEPADVLDEKQFAKELVWALCAMEHVGLGIGSKAVVNFSRKVHSLHVSCEMLFRIKKFPAKLALAFESFLFVLVHKLDVFGDAVLGRVALAAKIALIWFGTSRVMVSNVTAQISLGLKSFSAIRASKFLLLVVDLRNVSLQAGFGDECAAEWAKNFLEGGLLVFHVPLLLASHPCSDVNHESVFSQQFH